MIRTLPVSWDRPAISESCGSDEQGNHKAGAHREFARCAEGCQNNEGHRTSQGLMVNHEAQRRYETVIAPIDMSDVSANALRVALSIGLITDKGATLLHAFLAMAKGKMFVAASDQASIDSYVAGARRQAMDELATFLVSNDLKRARWSLRVEEGGPMEIISRAVAELRPDLLIMGTHGRSALLKVLIGSVTEEALRSLNVDILAVPPAKR